MKKSRKSKIEKKPNYIKRGGSTYERMSDTSVEVELDLEETVYNELNSLVRDGKFVSIGDAVRYILRSKIEEIESKTK